MKRITHCSQYTNVSMRRVVWFVLVMAVGFSAAYAQSAPTLDGLLDSVYYSHGYSVDYDGFYPQARATLYVLDNSGIDATNIWIAWVITRDFNDNSYNNNKHSSWPGGHVFDDLLESDLQRLDLENSCGELVLDATMDYIDGPPYHAAYSTISGYDVNMDATESVKLYINGGDWTKMAYKTSLVANLNTFGYCTGVQTCGCGGTDLMVDSPAWLDEPNYIPVASCSNWEYSLIWEVRIDRTIFQTATCTSGTILGVATNPIELHASPSKINVSPVTLFKASSAIGDYIWLDANRDGIQDITERGIPNVTVVLYTDPNGDGDPSDGAIVRTTTTDSYGRYLFSGLGEGNYVVDVTDSSGMLTGFSLTTGSTDPHGPITLGRNERYLHADFGYAPSDTTKAIIGDYIWSDADNDALQDPGEIGIGGVTVRLLEDIDGDGNFTDLVATTTTADDGSYLFMNVDPGDYKVDVTDTGGVLSGYTLTVGPQSSTDPTEMIHVEAGDVYLNADFGYYKTGLGTIGNQIWLDDDGDGVFEPANGETGIPNVTVDLIKDTNGNGVWDTGERVISSVTASDGTYQFVGLSLDDGDGDADYLVHVTDMYDALRRFRLSIGPTPGANNNSQADPYAVALTAASPSNQTADFGYWFDRQNGLVGDRVWYDLDGDSVQDPEEPGIEGVTVELWSMKKTGGVWNEDALLGYVTTDANGHYYFPNLAVGNNQNQGKMYRVKVVASNFNAGAPLYGYTPTNQPDNMDESELLYTDVMQDLTLDFGYRLTGGSYSIGDYVWLDGDADGVQDVGESGFANVTLVLYQDIDGDGVIDDGDPIIATDTTDANGNYLFTGLANGDYIVAVTDDYGILNGYTKTYGTQPWPVTISGASNLNIDYGYYRPSPTAAVVSSFRAYSDSGQVVVQWETFSEIGTVGFYLLRKDDLSGQYKPVNRALLTGLLHEPQGGIYRYVDNSAAAGQTYTYKVVEVEHEGGTRSHGPFTVTIEAGPPAPDPDVSRTPLEPMRGLYSKTPHGIPSSARESRLLARQQDLQTSRIMKKTSVGDEARIVIKEKGIYYLDAASIAGILGMSVKQVEQKISNHQLLLTNRGQEAAYLPAPGNTGLYFYGQDIDSIYTDENIYWLEKSKGMGMDPVYGGLPAPAGGSETFTDTLHVEQDRYALTALFTDPGEDYWFWDYISAGVGAKTFNVYVHDAADYGTAALTVDLQGATNTPADPDHHAIVSLNGTYIGDGQWDGTNAHQLTLVFDPSLLNNGPNTVEVKGVLDSGVPYSIFYVNSFDLEYRRYYRAVNNRLLCRGDGNPVITVDGFSDPNIMVFDVTDPRYPRLVTGTTIDLTGRVSFKPALPGNLYLAVGGPYGVQPPFSVSANNPSSLKQKQNSADYVVIVPEELENAVQGLVTLRQAKGLTTMTVVLGDIYNEFNYGIAGPEAIKAFISYAYHNWNGRVPKYVVLAGEGTYDYKNNLGYGENLVPPVLVSTPYGLFASDTYFGDVVGDDGVPEIAVGRLPVMSSRELKDLIDKISAYEYAGGSWTGWVMMLADNPDSGGDFPADSDSIAALIPAGYTVEKIYLPDFSNINEARQKLMTGFNRGALWINYIGHATLTQLANEKLFMSSDVSQLYNEDRLPLFTAMTCVVGRFEVPGFDTLSESLLLKNNGGAAAVWAPTGASLNSLANILAKEFYKTVFQPQTQTLGQAVVTAMQNYAVTGNPPFMLYIYTLLGDPALEIK